MNQVNVNREDMRKFFVNKLSEGGFAPEGVDYRWWPNAIENIFTENKSLYLDPDLSYPSPSLYELMVFCIYSIRSFCSVAKVKKYNFNHILNNIHLVYFLLYLLIFLNPF